MEEQQTSYPLSRFFELARTFFNYHQPTLEHERKFLPRRFITLSRLFFILNRSSKGKEKKGIVPFSPRENTRVYPVSNWTNLIPRGRLMHQLFKGTLYNFKTKGTTPSSRDIVSQCLRRREGRKGNTNLL